MKLFEIPELKVIIYAPKDILSTSEETTDATGGGDITTPEDDF